MQPRIVRNEVQQDEYFLPATKSRMPFMGQSFHFEILKKQKQGTTMNEM
jgi:hypothetical protein